MRLLFAALMSSSLAAGPAFAQSGDVARGEVLAMSLCTDCHAVTTDAEPSPNEQAPAFPKVANTSGTTSLSLTVFFQSPHPNMPNLIIPPNDARDLIAYILSFKD